MASTVLSCDGIYKTYERAVIPSNLLQERIIKPALGRNKWSKNVLNGVSLSLGEGEWVGIYGPNGSGKTTLLRILAGILPPDEGAVTGHAHVSSFFGLGAGFHQERSAVENVYLHSLLHGVSPKQARSSIGKIIEFAGIAGHEDLPIKCLSTGMALRLAFSAAAHIESEVYIFDEVLAVGDAAFQKLCFEHFNALREQGKTVLMVLHNLSVLEKLCDRVLYMEEGRLVSGQ